MKKILIFLSLLSFHVSAANVSDTINEIERTYEMRCSLTNVYEAPCFIGLSCKSVQNFRCENSTQTMYAVLDVVTYMGYKSFENVTSIRTNRSRIEREEQE